MDHTDDRDEDRQLWRHVTRGVKPIRRQKSLFAAEEEAQPAQKSAPKSARKKTPPRADAPPSGQSADRFAERPGHRGASPKESTQHPGTGLDRRSDRKLRRGEWDIEGRIDLHGLSRDRAYETLVRFITSAQAQGKRCVLVITGKGRSGQPGVIRSNLPLWLEGPPLGGLVLRYYAARPGDGGDGAFYVLLRRQRI